MRIAESRIRRIIREEVSSLREMRAPGYLSPQRTFQDIKDLVDEALMNKSFGMPGRVTDSYVSDLNKLIDHMNNGGQSNVGDGEEWDEDKHGFGSASPRRTNESIDDSFDDFGGGTDEGDPLEDDHLTAAAVIERYKDEGPRSWMRVSNDFYEMAEGGMDDILEKYYPGLTADDCAEIARTLDRHFGMG